MKIAIISFTQRAAELAEKIAGGFAEQGEQAQASSAHGEGKVSVAEWTADAFKNCGGLIFVGAVGIAVRSIAPYIVSKVSDPAVVCVDERARFAISLLSGHIGGANELALRTAEIAGAVPVITTATDVNNVFAVDTWARKKGLIIKNPENIKRVSSKLLSGETVLIKSQLPLSGMLPRGVAATAGNSFDVLISIKKNIKKTTLHLVPKTAVVGIGCRRNIEIEALETAFSALLAKGGIDERAICGVCSIDIKAQEPALLEFCERHGFPFRTYSAEELKKAKGNFSSSAFVQSITGVDNVCERSAVLGAEDGTLVLKKDAGNGITMALATKKHTLDFQEDI